MFAIPARFTPIVLTVLGVSLALNVMLLRDSDLTAESGEVVHGQAPALALLPNGSAVPAADSLTDDVAAEELALAALAAEAASQDAPVAPADAPAVPAQEPAQVAAAAPATNPDDLPVRILQANIRGSIPQTLNGPAAPYGDALSALTSRLYMWDMDLRRDLRAEDPISIVYTQSDAGEITVLATQLHSQRYNRTFTAYRYHATGDAYPRYWTADGLEVERRLNNSPIQDYEQITSLLRDRPDHHGLDFKANTGTPILSPFAGVVTRSNWNWSANGNCIEVRRDDGVLVKFLHLSENLVEPGARVSAGQQIALSGNTGHSSGPHLHYQLNRGSEVLDPVEIHGTSQQSLPEAERGRFNDWVNRVNQAINGELVAL